MIRFFTRACGKIGRFFWSWGFLKFVLAVIALVILLYVEEDWRGAHNWAVTKAKWEAQGETFDYAKFIPPPIPDDLNLAALPLFKLEPTSVTNGKPYLDTDALKKAMRSDLIAPPLEYILLGSWQRGELTDMAKVKKLVAGNFAIACKGQRPPEDSLHQFAATYPFLTDFLGSAEKRPEFRLNCDYAVSSPISRTWGPVTAQIKLSQILTQHAVLALDAHRSDLALQDIKITYQVLNGVRRDPSLIGGLVALGMSAINGAAIYNGLAQHEWSDAQLAEIDQTLRPINFLADYQFAMRCEAAESATNLEYLKTQNPSLLYGWDMTNAEYSPWASLTILHWPSGWWDENISKLENFHFNALNTVDSKSRRVLPELCLSLQRGANRAAESWDGCAPWSIWFTMASAAETETVKKYAEGQVYVDEMRIACALERYRLAHGVYPASLDALSPAYIDAVPHDILNGQPYHYSLRADGTFLLYSVGWNQTDDGGKVAYKSGNYTVPQIDYDQGDWVWPTPKY